MKYWYSNGCCLQKDLALSWSAGRSTPAKQLGVAVTTSISAVALLQSSRPEPGLGMQYCCAAAGQIMELCVIAFDEIIGFH